MFGNRRVREPATFQDLAFRTDLVNFIHNCTVYELDIRFRQTPCASAHGRDRESMASRPVTATAAYLPVRCDGLQPEMTVGTLAPSHRQWHGWWVALRLARRNVKSRASLLNSIER